MQAIACFYRALLLLYPSAFRGTFGDEMAADFEEATREALEERGWLGVLPLWVAIGADFGRTLLVQWLQTGLPVLIALSAAWSILTFGMIARQFLPLQRRVMPASILSPGEFFVLILIAAIALPVLFVMVTSWLRKEPRPNGDRHA
jgi:uncharacterized membrane protein